MSDYRSCIDHWVLRIPLGLASFFVTCSQAFIKWMRVGGGDGICLGDFDGVAQGLRGPNKDFEDGFDRTLLTEDEEEEEEEKEEGDAKAAAEKTFEKKEDVEAVDDGEDRNNKNNKNNKKVKSDGLDEPTNLMKMNSLNRTDTMNTDQPKWLMLF
ncbi:hypothetical protein BGX24_010738 [Mortierella sp. AD032]|nr:hypothetical protein BGX24_010738 [Mortierella sp. AD032]